MPELWPSFVALVPGTGMVDSGLLAADRGLLLGLLLGLGVVSGGVALLAGGQVLVGCWVQHRRRVASRQLPPDDWSIGLEQFSEAELHRLLRLRRTYRRRTPPTQQAPRGGR